ncbi:ferritin family protein [Niallia sp.]|uniref:ferritin family protein n=1 Tax=Niallia sp. TaxID=2837523 RepID=UPI0028971EF4|nr:ferritin family protein [Niallia sp.]
MYPSITTGLNGAIYQAYPSLYHSPPNHLFNFPAQSCHAHFGQGIYPVRQIPTDQYNFHRPNMPLDNRQNEVLFQISKAIDGEYAAIACYQKLKNLAPTKKEKAIITEIRKDEIRHYNTFSKLYTQISGKKHTPTIKEKCPEDYRKGIDFAFNDEQETVDLYLDIAYHTDNAEIKELFLRAAHDEQNHAVWFLYFMK